MKYKSRGGLGVMVVEEVLVVAGERSCEAREEIAWVGEPAQKVLA